MFLIDKKKFKNFFLIAALILLSGNPLVMSGVLISEEILTVMVFLIAFFFFAKSRLKIDREFIFFIIFLSFVSIVQSIQFNFFAVKTILGLFVKITTGYFIIRLIGKEFPYYYVKIIYSLSIVSLALYFLLIFQPSLFSGIWIDVTYSKSSPTRYSIFGLYTYFPRFFDRNNGPFWEAGAFAGYLVIAFIFNYLSDSSKRRRISLILGLCIVTTFSTTAYIALFVFFLIIFFKRRTNPIVKLLSLLLIILIGYFGFNKLDFLGKKIEEQYTFAVEEGLNSDNSQRFLSVLRDQKDIEGFEFFGRGWNNVTRFDGNYNEQIRTVGLTDIIVKVGVIFFIFISFHLYRSCRSLCASFNFHPRSYSIALLVVVFILLLSETYFNLAFFWALLFLQFNYRGQTSNAPYTSNLV